MSRMLLRAFPPLVLVLGFGVALPAGDPPAPAKGKDLPDLSEYRTVETAVTATLAKATPAAQGPAGYLGIHLAAERPGELVVAAVEQESPAAQAGLQVGDLLVSFAGQSVHDIEGFRDALHARAAGEVVKLAVARKGKPVEASVTLAAVSRPMKVPAGPGVFLTAVPYPSAANTAFTPDTTPSSRSLLGGGLPVHITNIRRLPDGRITFHIGYPYL
jgi:membrane-associated protease RseP (regulator of RpoE activity)